MHRTLKEETASPPSRNRLAQQRAFDLFRREYNHDRPHEALGLKPPSSLYSRSLRAFDARLRDPAYPDDVEPARVRMDGSVKWAGFHFHLTDVLAGELVGCERLESGVWNIHFGPLDLGALDTKGRFHQKKRTRRVLPM